MYSLYEISDINGQKINIGDYVWIKLRHDRYFHNDAGGIVIKTYYNGGAALVKILYSKSPYFKIDSNMMRYWEYIKKMSIEEAALIILEQ